MTIMARTAHALSPVSLTSFLGVAALLLSACGASTPEAKKPAPTPVEREVVSQLTPEPPQPAPTKPAAEAAQEVDAQAKETSDAIAAAPPAKVVDPMALLNDKSLRGAKDLVITAVGDVSQPTKQWPEPTNRLKGKVFDPTKGLLDSGDLVFMNLENPVSDLQPKVKKEFSFTCAPERLTWYMEAGFNLFSLSNNHIADANQEGIDDTLKHLDEKAKALNHKAWWAGASSDSYEDAESPVFVQVPEKNLTIAFFSTGNSRGPKVSKYWSAGIPKKIALAKKKADLVVISVHAGKEYKHVPEENLTTMYRAWVDAGADVVIGHHPHVIRPAEIYKGAVILHSLGNYVFASRTRRHREFGAKMYGLVARVVIKEGKVAGVELTPTWVNNTEDWTLEDGQRMPNANFVPQLITGKFADAFFEDFNRWSLEAGFKEPVRVKDAGVLRVDATVEPAKAQSEPDVASR